jgi:hypothetical protein
LLRAAAIASVVALVAVTGYYEAADSRVGFVTSDSEAVLDGVRALDICLDEGIWARCDERVVGTAGGHGNYGGAVGPFPLPQYAVGLALKRAGATRAAARSDLVYLSGLASLGVVVLVCLVALGMLEGPLRPLVILATLSGSILWYSEAAYGEALAMFLTTLVAALALFGASWPPLLAAALLAGVTKESAPLFVGMPGAAALATRGTLDRGKLAAVLSGCLAAAAVNGAFNVFRYGTVYNDYYTEPDRLVPGLAPKAQFVLGQIFAPNAGLVWFWTAAAVVLVLAGVVLVRRRHALSRHEWLAPLLLAGTFSGLLVLFAAYKTPYGWDAWGARYIVPWVPALLLVAAVAGGMPLTALTCSLLRRTWLVGLAVLVVGASALGQVGAFAHWRVGISFTHVPLCRTAAGLAGSFADANYYRCITHLAWVRRPVMIDAHEGLTSPIGISVAVPMAGCVLSLLLLARRSALEIRARE